MEQRIQKTIENLEKKRINAYYFETKEEAVAFVLGEAAGAETVGIGGSMTVQELKLDQLLKDQNKQVYWHWLVSPEERGQIREQAAKADLYLAGTNALTEAGELVNIDSVGNRVSAMFYGPKKVIVIAGINKLTTDVISAIDRVKLHAAPPNAKRLGYKTPCAATGQCSDCLSPQRMCSVTTIINYKPATVDLHVCLVGEALGY